MVSWTRGPNGRSAGLEVEGGGSGWGLGGGGGGSEQENGDGEMLQKETSILQTSDASSSSEDGPTSHPTSRTL